MEKLQDMLVLAGLEIFIISYMCFLRICNDYKNRKSISDYTNNFVFIFLVSIVLIFLGGLRGNFTSDYQNYTDIYYYIGGQSLGDIVTNANNNHTEVLYNLLNKVLYSLHFNEVILFLIISMFTIFFYITAIKENSASVGISVFLFVSTGLYFASFNQVRVILASAITFWGSRYIYKRQISRFILTVIIASLIHKTAILTLILLIVYPFKISRKCKIALTISTVYVTGITYIAIDKVVDIITQYVYTEYAQNGAYGMDGLPITSLVVPFMVLICVFCAKNQIDVKELREKICFFALAIYLILGVASLRIEMFQWIRYYFQPYTILLIPQLFCKQKSKKRNLSILLVMFSFFLYSLFSSSAKLEYIFFWDY